MVNYLGCDSILTFSLTIPQINTTINKTGTTLTAAKLIGNYQWMTCQLGTVVPINGANQKSYTATVNGSYALETSDSACKDTSDCVAVTEITNLNRISNNQLLKVIPNPNAGEFNVVLPQNCHNARIYLMDASGKIIITQVLVNGNEIKINTDSKLVTGFYLIKVESLEFNATQRILIAR